MPASRETLKRLVSSGHAVMEIDYGERVTAWNRKAERLLGIPARSALGRPCYEVLKGRDVYGNRYCHRTCPIANQARFHAGDPVHAFPLDVEAVPGRSQRVLLSTFAVESSRPSLAPIVHVLREPPVRASRSRGGAWKAAPLPWLDAAELLVPPPALTHREVEVLRLIAEGLPTPEIAQRLGILSVTVRNHVQAILRRLKVHNRIAAVRMARERDLL